MLKHGILGLLNYQDMIKLRLFLHKLYYNVELILRYDKMTVNYYKNINQNDTYFLKILILYIMFYVFI